MYTGCHLDLSLENIVISNGNFILNDKTNKITIDLENISFKIIDFGLSEIFKDKNGNEYYKYDIDENNLSTFHINTKYDIINQWQSPQSFNEQVYDARKSDVCFFYYIILYIFNLY